MGGQYDMSDYLNDIWILDTTSGKLRQITSSSEESLFKIDGFGN